MAKKRTYKITSAGDNFDFELTTNKKRELNRAVKYIAKYGKNQKTEIQEVQTFIIIKTQ